MVAWIQNSVYFIFSVQKQVLQKDISLSLFSLYSYKRLCKAKNNDVL